ncbi:MAG: hypothetical protein ACLGJC_05720 [Alphaproteobacteria bacterium]
MKERLIKLACRLDPWMGSGRRDRLPTEWRVEPRYPLWRRLPQVPAVLRGQFLMMLNIQPWPMAAGDAIATAARYVWTSFHNAASMPDLAEERRVRALEDSARVEMLVWLVSCALRLSAAGVHNQAVPMASEVWNACVAHHGSAEAVLANCPPADAADEWLKFGGHE